MIPTVWQIISLELHLAGLALWLGGMVFFLVVFGTAVNHLQPGVAIRILDRGRRKLEAISWTGIGLLAITGVVNLILRQTGSSGAGEFYTIAFSLKMIVFGAMIYHHAVQVFKYGPAITAMTAATPEDALSWPEPLRAQWQRWLTLLKINAALGPIGTVMGLVLLKS
jgi:uncharacterized membrane protein